MTRTQPIRAIVCTLSLALAAMAAAAPGNAQDRTQDRSMVISRRGIVAAESPLAAQAGATILARGGNAIDAAVATNAVMGVVEPMMNGMGGDLFAIVYDAKTQKLYGLNASGWAPAGLTIEFLKSKGITEMPQRRDSVGHRSRRGRRLVEAPRAIRHKKILRRSRPRDLLRARRLPRRRMGRRVLGKRGRPFEARSECRGALIFPAA